MCQFQIAPCVLRQLDQLIIALHPQVVEVRQGAALRVLGVGQHGTGGSMRQRQVLRLPGRQTGRLELLQQFALAQAGIELPVRAQCDGQAPRNLQAAQSRFKSRGGASAEQQFARADARHPVGKFFAGTLRQAHLALRDAEPGQAAQVALSLVHGQQERFGLVTQQFQVGQCARRDHAQHLALDRPFAGDFAHLLADGNRFAELDQACKISVQRVKGHTGHHHRRASGLAALRQRDVQESSRLFSVGKEQLVEVPHAVQQQRVGVPGLDRQVLADTGGVGCGCFAHRLKSSKVAARPGSWLSC